jgi:glycine betaine/proline transport system substrate-binding protein
MSPSCTKGARTAAALVCLIATTTCTSSSSEGTPDPSAGKEPVTIKLAQNDWLSAKLDDAIAKLLLEEQLHLKVELTNIDTNEQWPAIAHGTLHASLEVWTSGHGDHFEQYVAQEKTVENGGPLGPVAKKGFYFPSYLLSQYPDLAKWTGLTSEGGAAKIFRTSDSGDKGRLLSGDPSWVNYHDQIIDNLHLELVTRYAGSEDAEVAALIAAYDQRAPILIYFWLPHWAFNRYDLTAVELPSYSDACYARAPTKGVDCDYPAEALTKIIWPGLKDLEPRAYAFLHKLSISTAAQIDLMARVKIDGLSIDGAAREWIDANRGIWQTWLE